MVGSGYFPLKSLGKEGTALVWRAGGWSAHPPGAGSGGLGKWHGWRGTGLSGSLSGSAGSPTSPAHAPFSGGHTESQEFLWPRFSCSLFLAPLERSPPPRAGRGLLDLLGEERRGDLAGGGLRPLALRLGDGTGGTKGDCTEAVLSLGVRPEGGRKDNPRGWATARGDGPGPLLGPLKVASV